MLIIGIDPGISGSICFFQDGKIIDVVEMPTMTEGKKNKKQVNGSQIFNEISARTKKLDKSDYSDSKKLISTSTFQSAVEAQDKNRSSGPDIINRAGTENAPQGMSIEDVKRLLGN